MLNFAIVLIEMSHPIYLLQIEINVQATGGRMPSNKSRQERLYITTRLRIQRDVCAHPSPAELKRTLIIL